VDFGTSNTVVALWDAEAGEGRSLFLPEVGQEVIGPDGQPVAVVPSLIHYAAEGRRWLGEQVRRRELGESPATFRWMKRYVSRRSPVRRRVGGQEVSPRDAGRDFLAGVIGAAGLAAGWQAQEEIALTVPVEAFEDYEDWLSSVAGAAGAVRFRLIDEASAAALGYGAAVGPGNVYLVVDFGGGTLDAAVVRIDSDSRPGQHCRVLGKAGADLGGASVDGWLFAEVLARAGRHDSDDMVRRVSRQLLAECERAKEHLSSEERALVSVTDPDTGERLETEFTRGQLEDLLDQHDFFSTLDGTLRRALNAARERGYGEDDLRAVLLVGGSSLIPSVRRTVQRIFGRDRVRLDRPLDAVARGAAAFVAGAAFFDHVQHDYALRVVDPERGLPDYRVLVRRGTPYPTREPIARLLIRASHEGQTQLGLAIYELAARQAANPGEGVELVFDPSGAARLVELSADERERRERLWVNEWAPTFLTAEPPARRGEACFEAAFGIDEHKRLVVTVRDLRTGRLTHEGFPVVKLT
jgi:molecular chaperone DnaK (HSP70)